MKNYYLCLPDWPITPGIEGAPLSVEDFYERVKDLPALAVDTETTGLRPFHGDRVFALVFSDGIDAWYLRCANALPEPVRKVLLQPRVWYGHNLRFDAHQLHSSFGVDLAGTLHCTAIGARIEFNDHLTYDLGSCLKRINLEKRDAVMEYIKQHKLKSKVEIPHKKEPREILHFDRVPEPIMFLYACDDARGAYQLARSQLKRIAEVDALMPEAPPAAQIVKLERDLLPVVVRMERGGVRVDKPYCQEAIEHLSGIMGEKKKSFQELTGAPFTDSWQKFSKIFTEDRLKWGRSEKGNPSFSSDILETFDHPAAKLVVELRNAKSRVDFFATFLSEADSFGFVHPNFNAGGTATRRFSSSGPNFQNLTNDEDAPPELYSPRRALIPPDDCCIASFDYKQQEYALMLDYAGQMDVIQQVLNGADIHQATADMMGVSRRYAKTLNFMLLYGGGVAKLCVALFKPTVDFETLQAICFLYVYEMRGYEDEEAHQALVANIPRGVIEENVFELVKARDLKRLYFSKLPRVEQFIDGVISRGEERGYVVNWYGMRYWCKRRFSYVLPNRIIQGGGAEIGKRAMVATDQLLAKAQSRLFLPVHDELDFYLHRSDLERAPEIKAAMEGVYPHRHLPMRVDVSHSWRNLGDLEAGYPTESGRLANDDGKHCGHVDDHAHAASPVHALAGAAGPASMLVMQ